MSIFPAFLDSAVKTMSQGGNIRLAVMHGSLTAAVVLLLTLIATYFIDLPVGLTVATVLVVSFFLGLAVSLYVSEGGAQVVRLDGVVVKLNDEIEKLMEEAAELREREDPGTRLDEVYAVLDDRKAQRRKWLAIRTNVMVKRARLTQLEEEYDRLELKEIDERREVKRGVKKKRRR